MRPVATRFQSRFFAPMFRSYWGALIAVAGLIAAPLLAQQTSDASGGQPSTTEDRAEARGSPAQVVPAINRVADELAKTRNDQADPYGDERNERERRDLTAQEESAYWTQSNFWAMVVQTIVAAAALFFLLMDLRQNRKNAEAQLRAYVRIDAPGGPTRRSITSSSVEWSSVSYGQTPAIVSRVETSFFFGPRELPADHIITDWEGAGTAAVLHPSEPERAPTFARNLRMTTDEARAAINYEVEPQAYVAARITYRDVFGHEHVEQGCWYLHWERDWPDDRGARLINANRHFIST